MPKFRPHKGKNGLQATKEQISTTEENSDPRHPPVCWVLTLPPDFDLLQKRTIHIRDPHTYVVAKEKLEYSMFELLHAGVELFALAVTSTRTNGITTYHCNSKVASANVVHKMIKMAIRKEISTAPPPTKFEFLQCVYFAHKHKLTYVIPESWALHYHGKIDEIFSIEEATFLVEVLQACFPTIPFIDDIVNIFNTMLLEGTSANGGVLMPGPYTNKTLRSLTNGAAQIWKHQSSAISEQFEKERQLMECTNAKHHAPSCVHQRLAIFYKAMHAAGFHYDTETGSNKVCTPLEKLYTNVQELSIDTWIAQAAEIDRNEICTVDIHRTMNFILETRSLNSVTLDKITVACWFKFPPEGLSEDAMLSYFSNFLSKIEASDKQQTLLEMFRYPACFNKSTRMWLPKPLEENIIDLDEHLRGCLKRSHKEPDEKLRQVCPSDNSSAAMCERRHALSAREESLKTRKRSIDDENGTEGEELPQQAGRIVDSGGEPPLKRRSDPFLERNLPQALNIKQRVAKYGGRRGGRRKRQSRAS
ncbi:hypothetical protein EJ08DRAFT_711810 [Tothia fuscella]|uniref:Uncharacterized protein n=1 Tax=Tothia fuscella TaxID=1048955 RepID=A0A9P4NVM1_9PEZI|nr:hypothetical protein EJ08DRAFT_711810 [Tothia fuscella]